MYSFPIDTDWYNFILICFTQQWLFFLKNFISCFLFNRFNFLEQLKFPSKMEWSLQRFPMNMLPPQAHSLLHYQCIREVCLLQSRSLHTSSPRVHSLYQCSVMLLYLPQVLTRIHHCSHHTELFHGPKHPQCSANSSSLPSDLCNHWSFYCLHGFAISWYFFPFRVDFRSTATRSWVSNW